MTRVPRRAHPAGRTAALAALLVLAPAGALAQASAQAPAQTVPPQARVSPAPASQTAAPQTPVAPQAQQPAPSAELPRVSVTAGRSTVVATDFNIDRIAITNPAVADAVVVEPRQILIDGKTAGTISLIVWGGGRRVQYDLVVEQPVTALEQQIRRLFPEEQIQVLASDGAIVLSGRASSTEVMLRAAEIVTAASPTSNVINMLQVPGGSPAQQVMLQVRIAEVSRRAVIELGASFFTGATGAGDWIGRGTTQQFAAPGFDNLSRTEAPNGDVSLSGEMTFSDFLNLFLFNTDWNVGALVRALESTGYFQSLAEPNLIAYNGKEASFLAGGEIAVPVVQGVSGAVSVLFKEFGIRLSFTPTIAGDLIRLKVRPEVSSLDFNNAVTLEGFRIPSLITRRAQTEVELRDGQSFAIAGLLDNTAQTDRAAVPLLSRIPIIGHLFRSKAERQTRTELLVLITPRLVRALSPDEVPPLPTLPGRFLPRGGDVGKQLDGGGGTEDAPALAPPARRRR